MAQQALTVQDATDNRLALGIGLSHKFVIENSLGSRLLEADPTHP